MPPRKKKAEPTNGEVAPRKKRQAKTQQPVTSKQRLSTIIKGVRDKLREDAGISTDAERLPQLTWMLFLKFLDDHEKAQHEERGHRYVPVIEAPYRWRDWAVPADIQTARKGDDLLTFVNTDLFEYLRKRSGGGQNDLREIVGRSSGAPTISSAPATSCGKWSKRSVASTSTPPTTFTSCRTSTRRCSRRCATPPASRASFTRHVR